MKPKALIKRHPIAFYFVLALLITYVLGIPAYLFLTVIQKRFEIDFSWAKDLVFKFGPTLAGVLTIALTAGKVGLRNLFRRCVRWRFPISLYLLAVLVQPAILLAALLLRGYGSEVQTLSPATAIRVFALQVLVNVFLGGGLSEELGWRGFMLPHLCQRYSPLVASLFIGIAWFAWHVPAYIFMNKGASDPLLPFTVIMFPFSIIHSWAYFRSKESLLLPVLLHGSINASFYAMEGLLPDGTSADGFQPNFDWMVAILWCIFAGIIVVKWGTNLGKETAQFS